MLKALEILRQKKETCIRIYNGDDYSDGLDSYKEIIEQTDEAIKELEELENEIKNCCGDDVDCQILFDKLHKIIYGAER